MLFTMELEDVLFFRERKAYARFKEELDVKHHGDGDAYTAAHQANLLEKIGSKEGFYARIEDYEKNGGVDVMEFVPLRREDVRRFLDFGTAQHGAGRCEMAEGIADGWAVHLRDYGRAVNYADDLAILELGSGAGMGTWAVASQLRPGSVLVSTDFDAMCIKNADGIARHLGLSDRVSGLLANFWRLPFADQSLDAVCTHYALDEAREAPAILAEAARVLKPGGRFILTARIHPWDRQRKFMEPFGIAPGECDALLRRARLQCGPAGLAEWAAQAGLSLLDRTDYAPEGGHARTVLVFSAR
ncbi:MAG: class I SAM-dependent methyltransferase [Oscillospiraceae bacterium]|jgi:SAM-dependent methyltransferase|nr:class I SAM-dependent methyltransferase [Oscillospiraceae bacterium]